MSKDMFVPMHNSNGELTGMFDMKGLYDASDAATKAAIFNLDADRAQMVHDSMRAVKSIKPESQAIILAGTIADLLETFQGVADVAEAYGVPVRAKFAEIWGGDAA